MYFKKKLADQATLSPYIETAFLCQRCILQKHRKIIKLYFNSNLIPKNKQNNKSYLFLTKITTGVWVGSGIERSHVL